MASPNPIAVGLMGLGVVGSGVARAIHQKQDVIAARLGRPVQIKSILVRNKEQPRAFVPHGTPITTDAAELLQDPAIQIIVEVMGGEQPAFDYIQAAISAGKHVVTANKEVMAKHGPEILTLGRERGVGVRFEASVGGGIPIIGPLLKDLLANEITGVRAIINGTTNYVLTRMAREGLDFGDCLQQAQALGYAEANPANDIEGVDAAYKLAILSTLAFHSWVHASDVYCEGITRLTTVDFQYAADLGYAVKLLAIGRQLDSAVQVRVHPAFVPIEHPLAKVDGVFNAVELQGDLVDQVMFHGRGAGDMPTTSAVIGDVLDLARGIASGVQPVLPPKLDAPAVVQPMDDLETQYYIRLRAADKPGVMAQITRVLGDLHVSIAAVIQKSTIAPEQLAEIVVTTHLAREAAIQQAIRQLALLEVVQEVSNMVRIEAGEF